MTDLWRDDQGAFHTLLAVVVHLVFSPATQQIEGDFAQYNASYPVAVDIAAFPLNGIATVL